MLMKDYFYILSKMVEQIADRLPSANEHLLEKLESEVHAIRKISDSVLTEWLKFEQDMTDKIGKHFPKQFSTSTFFDFMQMTEAEINGKGNLDHSQSLDEDAHYLQAKGYFDLGLYKKSFSLLMPYIASHPDNEIARLYFAYSAFYSENREEAIRHFQLLKVSSTNAFIRAVSYNALGIIQFDEMQYSAAKRSFAHAMKEDNTLYSAYYNLGMAFHIAGDYKQAIRVWEQYMELTHDHELELLFFLSNCYLKLGNHQSASSVIQLLVPHHHEQSLALLGKFFEETKQHSEAIKCYRKLLELNASHSEAYHGLGWNTWLADESNEEAIPLLKKALSLQTDNLNVVFSLAWIYFHKKQYEDSNRTNQWLLTHDPDSPVANSLAFLLAIQHNDLEKGKKYSVLLQEHQDTRTRALGELLAGKLQLQQFQLREAISSFKRSIRQNPSLKESHLMKNLEYIWSDVHDKVTKI